MTYKDLHLKLLPSKAIAENFLGVSLDV